MAAGLWPLQQAVYEKLAADPTLTAKVTGVFDEVPDGQPYPYVTIGSAVGSRDDTHDAQGLEVLLTLHVWSEYPGYREAAEIFTALDAVLDRQPLTVTGWHDISIAHLTHQSMRDPDPKIRHISAQYRVWMTRD